MAEPADGSAIFDFAPTDWQKTSAAKWGTITPLTPKIRQSFRQSVRVKRKIQTGLSQTGREIWRKEHDHRTQSRM
jgi:hypothetical protein